MNEFKQMVTSSTNWILFLMVIALIGFNVFAILYYPDTLFKDVFAVFTNILTGFAGYKYGKSMPQQPQDANKPAEKKDEFVV